MDIRQHSSQFTIYVFTLDIDLGASAKVHLSQAGYDTYFFQDPEILEQRLKENAPHVLVFPTQSVSGSLTDFVKLVHDINDEIKFVAISSVDQFEVLAQYNGHGFVDVLSDEKKALASRILWSVDRACEKIYLTYQNEQLFESLEESKAKSKEAQDEPAPPVSMRIKEYRSASSKEDLIQKFMNQFSQDLCLFFKFLPTVRSFVATHAQGVSVSDIQGVGVQLESQDMKDLTVQFSMGILPVKFSNMLVEAFRLQPPKALPLYTHKALEGAFIYSGSLAIDEIRRINEEFTLMSLCYANFSLEKKVDALEVQDFVTELYNRNYYQKIVSEEVSRGRRLQKPISVVKIAIDDIYEIESSLGESVRDELLRAVAGVVVKTSRTNDVTCRTAANEIAMVLPHTSRKGAALRAERLRRIIESMAFMDNGMKVSISLGVSEYPTLCDSAKSLDETATKALTHIVDKGGNKICLYKASESHKPEFEIPAE